jgi:hypothetical protein
VSSSRSRSSTSPSSMPAPSRSSRLKPSMYRPPYFAIRPRNG